MATLGVIGLLIAIVFLIVGAFKGLGALPLTMISAFIVIIFNGMSVWDSFSEFYIGGYAGAYTSYLLLFMFSALYAKIMNETKCATTIGYKLVDWFGKKNVILISVLITAILTYGGVSMFVVIFAVGPIMFVLFKEANLPRHLTLGCLALGGGTFTMTCLPGSPQLTNVIPTSFLNTSLTAAPVLGIICAAAIFAIGMFYLKRAEKKAIAAKETFTFPKGYNEALLDINRDECLSAIKAFIPPVLLVVIILVGSKFMENATELSVIAMIVGCIAAVVLNFDKMKGIDPKNLLSVGLNDGIAAIGGLAAVIGFGTVTQHSGGFEIIVNAVLGLDLSPYFKGVLSTAAIAGITGSSSGGLRIMLQSMGDYFINSGCNLEVLHRICAIAAGSLDSLPHASAIFLQLAALGLTHKEAYKHMFITTVVAPGVVAIGAALVCTVIGF